MHELDKIDVKLGLPVGLTKSVFVDHNTENVTVLRNALVVYGVRINEDTSIPKEDRSAWKSLALSTGLPPEWLMDEELMETEEIPELGIDN
jgi:hypothetical protein